jgi:hypothetical protein
MPHTQLVLYDADVSSSLSTQLERSRKKKRKNIFSAGVVIILAAVSGHIFNYDENLMLHCMVWSRNRSMTSSSCHLLKGGGTMPQSYRAIHGAYCNRYARACAYLTAFVPFHGAAVQQTSRHKRATGGTTKIVSGHLPPRLVRRSEKNKIYTTEGEERSKILSGPLAPPPFSSPRSGTSKSFASNSHAIVFL